MSCEGLPASLRPSIFPGLVSTGGVYPYLSGAGICAAETLNAQAAAATARGKFVSNSTTRCSVPPRLDVLHVFIVDPPASCGAAWLFFLSTKYAPTRVKGNERRPITESG